MLLAVVALDALTLPVPMSSDHLDIRSVGAIKTSRFGDDDFRSSTWRFGGVEQLDGEEKQRVMRSTSWSPGGVAGNPP